MIEVTTRPAERERIGDQRAAGRDVVGRAAFRLLRSALEGTLPDERSPYVAAAVLNAHAHAKARRKLVAPRWLHWAGLAVEPARSRLAELAQLTGADAA